MIKLQGYICEDRRDVAIWKVCQDKNVNLIYIFQLSQKVLQKDTFILKAVK